jgi:hypothetical protein
VRAHAIPLDICRIDDSWLELASIIFDTPYLVVCGSLPAAKDRMYTHSEYVHMYGSSQPYFWWSSMPATFLPFQQWTCRTAPRRHASTAGVKREMLYRPGTLVLVPGKAAHLSYPLGGCTHFLTPTLFLAPSSSTTYP